MSLTQIVNLRHPDLIERMAQFVDMDVALTGVFRCVLTIYNNDWSLLMGVLVVGESDSDMEHQIGWYKYPNFQFVCKPFEGITLTELMSSINNDGYLPILDSPRLESKEKNINWTESLIPGHVSNSSFPERCFSAQMNSGVYCQDRKLVAYDMDFHPSAFEYVKEFLGLDVFHGSSDSRKGELLIKIPDRRGYLTLSDHEVSFHCESTDTLSVVGRIDGESVKLNSPQDTFRFEPEKATDIELWLVTNKDEIIDYRSSSEWQYRYGPLTKNLDLASLLQIINGGESEHCEFKKYIDLVTKQNNKAWEIDKTVCALSNHQGGKLFIGVDDDTRIIGINEGCKRDYKCNPEESAELYLKAVTKRLQESLSKNQCFNAYLVENNQLLVLVVEVHKANGLNYLIAKNEAYIRRGASSPQMTLAEVKEFPAEQDPLGRQLF